MTLEGGAPRRVRTQHNAKIVVGLLLATCLGMLGAIYWVVQSGKL